MVTGSDGHGTLGGHGKARIERIGHTPPPVHPGADAGVIADDRQRQGIRQTVGLPQGRLAPVAQGIEAPGLQTVEGMSLPALEVQRRHWAVHSCRGVGRRHRRAGFAMAALKVGGIEVEPAPLIEVAPGSRAVTVVVVTLAIELRKRLARLRQGGKHRLAPGYVGAAAVGCHSVDAQRVERMAFRGDQIPASITFFGTEEALGIEARTCCHAAKLVARQMSAFSQPALELLLFTGRSGFELVIADDFFRPAAAG
ncbi:hypothetical protein D9M71_490000 [compost metagenome]